MVECGVGVNETGPVSCYVLAYVTSRTGPDATLLRFKDATVPALSTAHVVVLQFAT